MSCVDFKAKSLCFNSYSAFNGCYTLWLLHHFPLLQDLYFPTNSPDDLARADCGDLKFKSLQRAFVY
ncbi:hypothetical protein DSO57_1039113 [Entomophthora muscae]|uniref:Uncharacterized protein n=1 Tax=Entomophthora muscae TaxID=34485 RepID=A0ACC2U7X7_9FUNG|nr:hypothetical protein DSO57_1039113 [Entomophthora muscae]